MFLRSSIFNLQSSNFTEETLATSPIDDYNYDEATVGLFYNFFEQTSVESPIKQNCGWARGVLHRLLQLRRGHSGPLLLLLHRLR